MADITRKTIISFLTLALCMLALLVLANGQATQQSDAVIINTGSTSNNPYRIVVSRSGEATFVKEPLSTSQAAVNPTVKTKTIVKPQTAQIPPELVARFFRHMDTAMPFSRLPVEYCQKDSTLPSKTYITFQSQQTPDLSCTADPTGKALYDDAVAISMIFATKTAATTDDESSGIQRITLANNNKTIHVKVGDTINLSLSNSYDWAVTGFDQAVLARRTDISTPTGSQGLFKATAAGQTIMRAEGQPHCPTSNKNCGLKLTEFAVTLVVQ
ncbi:MAG TPA: hypothetical protein VFC63_20520 [Blastocatellia bacterium]|nr:hypothetical protein [Blastocatellia bacterium]